MRQQFQRVPKLKLKDIDTQAFISGAQDILEKRSIFFYFMIFRIGVALSTPLIIGLSFLFYQYLEKGSVDIVSVAPEVMILSLVEGALFMLYFFKKSARLRYLFDCLIHKKEITGDDVISAFHESFGLPLKLALADLCFMVLVLMVPLVLKELFIIQPLGITLRRVILGWWLGTIALLNATYMYSQEWVERAFHRLYNYGVMLPQGATIKRGRNIYLRILIINSATIFTLILVYTELFYSIIQTLPEGVGLKYTLQLVLTGFIVVAGVTFFSMMIVSSIKRSIDILLNKMDSVREGDYSVRILNFRDDEIGRLYDEFDFMLTSMNRVLAGLEKEVHARTAKLEEVLSKMSKYLSPQLYSRIYSDETSAELSYSRKKLTIFFSDIIGFTNISENLAPEDLSRVLNQYLDAMADIALKWGGTIDKYIGDAVMIFFGDPEFTDDRDHAVRCVRMAREMLEKLDELRDEWAKAGIPYELHIRIGVNTGYCTVGNFGSETRMDYTVLGDAVNLASRLQTAAPQDSILMSETTMLLVRDDFICDYIGNLKLKGIETPVKAYRAAGEAGIASDQVTEVHLNGFDLRLDPVKIGEGSRKDVLKSLKRAYDLIKEGPGE